MDERQRKYYQWRIRTIFERAVGYTSRRVTVVTAARAADRPALAATIHALCNQSKRLPITHRIITPEEDAPALQALLQTIIPPTYYTIEWLTHDSERYPTDLLNRGLRNISGGWVLPLPVGTIVSSTALATLQQETSAKCGVLLFAPLTEAYSPAQSVVDFIQALPPTDLPVGCYAINANVVHLADYQHRDTRDFLFLLNHIAFSAHYGFTTKLLETSLLTKQDGRSLK